MLGHVKGLRKPQKYFNSPFDFVLPSHDVAHASPGSRSRSSLVPLYTMSTGAIDWNAFNHERVELPSVHWFAEVCETATERLQNGASSIRKEEREDLWISSQISLTYRMMRILPAARALAFAKPAQRNVAFTALRMMGTAPAVKVRN